MNFDMLEMNVIRKFDADIGRKNVTSTEAALNVASCIGFIASAEMEGGDDAIEFRIGQLIHAVIVYCETKNLTLTKCLERVA